MKPNKIIIATLEAALRSGDKAETTCSFCKEDIDVIFEEFDGCEECNEQWGDDVEQYDPCGGHLMLASGSRLTFVNDNAETMCPACTVELPLGDVRAGAMTLKFDHSDA